MSLRFDGSQKPGSALQCPVMTTPSPVPPCPTSSFSHICNPDGGNSPLTVWEHCPSIDGPLRKQPEDGGMLECPPAGGRVGGCCACSGGRLTEAT